ncbi:hypothetical protein [Enterobacter roggenkampii]|uniref:hypothetical protein n=1 Tax=Enterobacter roggenkampii TaxID=1812935 RepID=UPI00240E87A3|nr:hypothetical protein [Enterobacter roggenkampii]WFC79980.1 hypothetical protein OM095_08915 [Enterobacter roggenkampii]
MITEKNNVFYCDCGFSFQRGRSGAHDCADGLRNKLAESEAKCAALAAENAGLKEWSPNPHSASMFEAIEKAEELMDDGMPELAMIEAFEILKMKRTPETDAFLAEVRAQGVEMAAKSDQFSTWVQQGLRSFAIGVRQGDECADELRKGVQS